MHTRSDSKGSPARAVAALLLAVALLAASAAAAHAATLSGTITSQSGGDPLQPLDAATVTVSSGGTPVTSALSDPAGAYTLSVANGTYDIEVSATGKEPIRFDGVALSGSVARDATLVPTGHGRLFGVVRDELAAPVAGAVVRVGGATSTTTAVDGSFSAAAPLAASTLTITGGATGASWTFQASGFSLVRERPVALDLPASTTFTVRVLGLADAPISNVRVRVPQLWRPVTLSPSVSGHVSNDRREGYTNVAGEVDASVLDGGTPRGFGTSVDVAPDPASFYDRLAIPSFSVSGPTTLVARPARFSTLSLAVHDADDEPVGVWASINGGTEYSANQYPVVLPVLMKAGEGTSVLSARGFMYAFVSDPFHLTGAQSETIELPPLEFTDITVVDENDDPVEGAFVRWPGTSTRIEGGWIDGTVSMPIDGYTTYASGQIRIWHYADSTVDPLRPGEITAPSGSGLASRTYVPTRLGTAERIVLSRR